MKHQLNMTYSSQKKEEFYISLSDGPLLTPTYLKWSVRESNVKPRVEIKEFIQGLEVIKPSWDSYDTCNRFSADHCCFDEKGCLY